MRHFQLIRPSGPAPDGSTDPGGVVFEGLEDDAGKIQGVRVGQDANGVELHASMSILQIQFPGTEVYGGGES